jgi:hypothetical protein
VSTPPLALLVATQRGGAAARLAGAMRRAGFRIAAAAPRGSHLALSAVPEAFRPLPAFGAAAALAAAVDALSPALLVPCDDVGAGLVIGLRGVPRLAPLVERSLGDPKAHPIALAKTAQVAHAAGLGLPVPGTRPLADAADFLAALAEDGLPAVLKVDGTWGGNGVALLRRPEEATPAWAAATTRPGWGKTLKTAMRERSLRAFAARAGWRQGALCLQRMVPGQPANRAVACWEGKVLAGLSVEALRTMGPAAPAAVVRIIDHPGMAAAAAAMVASLGLSGLHGFDFMLEEATGEALLIELNPRATPACCFDPPGGAGLAAALLAALTGAPAPEPAPEAARAGEVIAQFPGAWLTDPTDPLLRTPAHDVPWEDPGVMRAVFAEIAADAFMERWRDRLRGHRR